MATRRQAGIALGLSLQLERRERLAEGRVAHERAGERTEKDLARAGRLLEARRHVDGVSGDEGLAPGGVAGHHRAAVHPRAHRKAHIPLGLEVDVERVHRGHQVEGRPAAAQGVVLARGRDAEDAHHRVADELLDRAAVAGERPLAGREVAHLDVAERLGIEPLAEGGGAGLVGEDDGHLLARLRGGRR